MYREYMHNLLITGKSSVLFDLRKAKRREFFNTSDIDVLKHFNNIKSNGYSVVRNYLPEQKCAEICELADQAIVQYPQAMWTGLAGADKRIFGIENLGGPFFDFFNDQLALNVGAKYFGGKITNLQTLLGRIDAVEGNVGSGEGWHRDGNHFQYKAILYLSDVTIENGPFQIIRDSQRFANVISDSCRMNLDNPLNTRLTSEQVDTLTAEHPDRLVTFTAPAGTMLLVDVSTIHRGAPIRQGRRYALTNYYYPNYDIEGRKEKFIPRLTSDMVSTLV